MTQDTQQLWTEEQHTAYELGMQTEREHQEALARLSVRKHQEQIDDLAARLERAEQELVYVSYLLEDARDPELLWDDERIDAQVQDFGMGDAARRGMRVMRNEYEKQLHLLRRQLFWWEEEHKAMKNTGGQQ